MSKKAGAIATPADGSAALACGNAECRKALAPPLLQCSKCKAEAYCCKACQVGHPAAPATHRAPQRARPRLLTHPRLLPSPLSALPRRQIAAEKAGHKHECGAPLTAGSAWADAVTEPSHGAAGGSNASAAKSQLSQLQQQQAFLQQLTPQQRHQLTLEQQQYHCQQQMMYQQVPGVSAAAASCMHCSGC